MGKCVKKFGQKIPTSETKGVEGIFQAPHIIGFWKLPRLNALNFLWIRLESAAFVCDRTEGFKRIQNRNRSLEGWCIPPYNLVQCWVYGDLNKKIGDV